MRYPSVIACALITMSGNVSQPERMQSVLTSNCGSASSIAPPNLLPREIENFRYRHYLRT